LVDQINKLGDRLKALNHEEMMGDARKKLEEWRVECHQKIDHFFKQQCRELDRQVAAITDKQREDVSRIQSKAAELIREEHATRRDLDLLTSTINNLEQQVNKIEQTSFNIRCQSLEIDETSIMIEELGTRRFNLSALSTINRTTKYINESWPVVASNDHVLLMHQKPNLCLVDRHLKVVKHVLWDDKCIYDMCWSSVLDRFIIISPENVSLFDPDTMSIKTLPLIQRQNWLRGTCSDTSLFLSTYEVSSSIIEYSLLPAIQLIQHWKSPDTCEKNEIISHMRSNNETIALIITAPLNKIVRMEVKNSKTLARLWSLPLNGENIPKFIFSCCSVNDDEWLVIDCETSRLLHVSKQGKLQATCQYQSKPSFATMFSSKILAISTNNELNLHTLEPNAGF
jgi:hypothetical protein